jgi:hypothetical protein
MSGLLRTALLAAGAVFVVPSVAFAQAATQNINLNATVADYCSINGSATGAAVSRTITVTNGTVDTSALPVVSVANVACSKISDLQLSTTNTGLTGPGAAAGFQNVIHYTAVASFDGAAPSLNTSSASSATAATTGAATGTLTVNITPNANASPMRTGSYADTLVVTLTPQP